MLTLLTATGARPEAWTICERLMAAQTYAGPVRWVIVDDGPQSQPVTFSRSGWTLEVVRPEPFWAGDWNTQSRNLLAGLERIGADERVLVIEDDDHYAPGWLAAAAAALDRAELIGEPRARYYNLALRRARQLSNTRHASLCSTGMRGAALALFRAVCRERLKFIDLELWRRFMGPTKLLATQMVTGIKGLPGRGGIGMGHDKAFKGTDDAAGAILRQWVGADAGLYGEALT